MIWSRSSILCAYLCIFFITGGKKDFSISKMLFHRIQFNLDRSMGSLCSSQWWRWRQIWRENLKSRWRLNHKMKWQILSAVIQAAIHAELLIVFPETGHYQSQVITWRTNLGWRMNSRSHQYYFTRTSPQKKFGEREVGVKIEFQDKSPMALEPAVIPAVQKETEKP